jgi:hypothetical protein
MIGRGSLQGSSKRRTACVTQLVSMQLSRKVMVKPCLQDGFYLPWAERRSVYEHVAKARKTTSPDFRNQMLGQNGDLTTSIASVFRWNSVRCKKSRNDAYGLACAKLLIQIEQSQLAFPSQSVATFRLDCRGSERNCICQPGAASR